MGALPQNSQGRPWNGDYVFSSGDLVEDLTHNFFLETGARNGKLKVYETVEHPAARALTGFLLVRGGVHQVAYARALERLTGADLMKLFPSPRIPTDKIPECQPHIKRGDHLRLYRFSPDDYKELAAVFNGPHPETGEELIVEDESPEGFPAHDLPVRAVGVRSRLRPGGDRCDRGEAPRPGRPPQEALRRGRKRQSTRQTPGNEPQVGKRHRATDESRCQMIRKPRSSETLEQGQAPGLNKRPGRAKSSRRGTRRTATTVPLSG